MPPYAHFVLDSTKLTPVTLCAYARMPYTMRRRWLPSVALNWSTPTERLSVGWCSPATP